jgi:phosphopantetheinyl transferase
VKILGDEYHTKQKKRSDGDIKKKQERLPEYEAAVRANRQLAVVLRNQGLNEVADRFAYRAHVLQWHVLYWQLPEQLEEIQSHSQQQGTGQQNANEGAQFNLPGDCTIVCVNGQSGKT